MDSLPSVGVGLPPLVCRRSSGSAAGSSHGRGQARPGLGRIPPRRLGRLMRAILLMMNMPSPGGGTAPEELRLGSPPQRPCRVMQ